MGWDAYATYGDNWVTFLINGQPERLIPPHSQNVCAYLKAVFAEADEKIKQYMGFASIVSQGCLQVPGQRLMLERATGQPCIDLTSSSSEITWTPDRVKELYKGADWGFTFTDEDAADYWEARIFMETCALNGLGIFYDW